MTPCCMRCNLYKSYFRADCDCEVCIRAWENMAQFILPKTKKLIPMIEMEGALAYKMIERRLVYIGPDLDEEEETG